MPHEFRTRKGPILVKTIAFSIISGVLGFFFLAMAFSVTMIAAVLGIVAILIALWVLVGGIRLANTVVVVDKERGLTVRGELIKWEEVVAAKYLAEERRTAGRLAPGSLMLAWKRTVDGKIKTLSISHMEEMQRLVRLVQSKGATLDDLAKGRKENLAAQPVASERDEKQVSAGGQEPPVRDVVELRGKLTPADRRLLSISPVPAGMVGAFLVFLGLVGLLFALLSGDSGGGPMHGKAAVLSSIAESLGVGSKGLVAVLSLAPLCMGCFVIYLCLRAAKVQRLARAEEAKQAKIVDKEAARVLELIESLDRGSPGLRAVAAFSLSKFGAKAAPAIPALEHAAAGGDANLRRAAQAALKSIRSAVAKIPEAKAVPVPAPLPREGATEVGTEGGQAAETVKALENGASPTPAASPREGIAPAGADGGQVSGGAGIPEGKAIPAPAPSPGGNSVAHASTDEGQVSSAAVTSTPEAPKDKPVAQ